MHGEHREPGGQGEQRMWGLTERTWRTGERKEHGEQKEHGELGGHGTGRTWRTGRTWKTGRTRRNGRTEKNMENWESQNVKK